MGAPEKAALFDGPAILSKVLAAATPNEAKALGRRVRGYAAKFAQSPALRAYLRATGQCVIVESSPVDAIWGVAMAAADARVGDPSQWQGPNLLGFALMVVRAQQGACAHASAPSRASRARARTCFPRDESHMSTARGIASQASEPLSCAP